MTTCVIDLGGSLIAPGEVDVVFVSQFRDVIASFLEGHSETRMAIVCGGGALARHYQQAGREIAPDAPADDLDWIGVASTRVNAEVLRVAFGPYCADPVVIDPTAVVAFTGRVLIGAGWKPGFSTDYDAVLLADEFGAHELIRLSNIEKVYTADPDVDPTARPLDRATWREYREIMGDEWRPGKSGPMDPVAARKAEEMHLKVVFAGGSRLDNLAAILAGTPFVGTLIGPD